MGHLSDQSSQPGRELRRGGYQFCLFRLRELGSQDLQGFGSLIRSEPGQSADGLARGLVPKGQLPTRRMTQFDRLPAKVQHTASTGGEATRVSCFRHDCRLRDRCPSCGQGLAPFRQARLMSQQTCVFCDAPLTKPTGMVGQGIRRLERLVDDLVRLDTAGRVQDDQKSLAARLVKFPVPVGSARSTLPHLSHALRHDFFRRLSEGRTGIEKQKVHGPQTLWTRLANGAENHSGVVGVLADRLMETAGLERAACLSKATRSGRPAAGSGPGL